MLLDSVIIKLTKNGVGISPDYSLTIHGNGKVIYDGKQNVKVKGKVESFIDKNKVVSLLSQFKEAGFFSFNDLYSREDSVGRPYTIISISIPKENGEMITKSIKYYHRDRNAPKELKTLENSIDENVDTNRWIEDLSEFEGFKSKKDKKSKKSSDDKSISSDIPKKRPTKLIAAGVTFIIIVVVLFLAFESGIIKLSIKESQNGSAIKYDIPEITNFITASNVNEFRDYDQSVYFEPGDIIYIYYEYTNISTKDDRICNINIDLTVSFNSVIYHSNFYRETNVKKFSKMNFSTEDSWPSGSFLVKINFLDNISKISISSQTSFTLVDEFSENPEIIVLKTASEVRSYQDYDSKTIFNRGENVSIYQEYKNITTINITSCDLYLDIIVIRMEDEFVIHTDNFSKSVVRNNAHHWFFGTNSNWTSSLYKVIANLKDNTNNESTSSTTFFSLI